MATITGPGGLFAAEIIGPGPFKVAITGPPGPVIARTGYRVTVPFDGSRAIAH